MHELHKLLKKRKLCTIHALEINCAERQVTEGFGRAEQRDQRGLCFKWRPQGAALQPAQGHRLADQSGKESRT